MPVARVHWTRIVIVLLAVLAIMSLPAGRPASALLTEDVPIQPGAPIVHVGFPWGPSFCTMNFVFKDKSKKKNPKTYIGTTTSCSGDIGSRVRSPQVGVFGTVVYAGLEAGGFALIQIHRNKLKYVSPVVRGLGAAPTGYTTSRTAKAGDPLITHGYPLWATHEAQAVTRVGVLGGVTSTRYWTSIQPNIQEKGSPVIRADGKAVGISYEESSFWATWLPEAPPIARYPTVEGLLRRLRSAGFKVTLA